MCLPFPPACAEGPPGAAGPEGRLHLNGQRPRIHRAPIGGPRPAVDPDLAPGFPRGYARRVAAYEPQADDDTR